MGQFKKIPKGCGNCNNKSLDLTNLVARCMRCGWSTNLTSINDYLERMKKRKQ